MISIVMPAYNVGKYISNTLDSLIKQTYKNWELIISDDCSTDNTVDIIREYQKRYSNITLIRERHNHGGARIPRYNAILAAKGKYVCPIDADDCIETNFLEKLMERKKETNADVVLGRMIICNEDLSPRDRCIPDKNYNINEIFTGREACRRTIGRWEIAMDGLLTSKDLYVNFINKIDLSTFSEGFADETDQRKFLLTAKSVAMTDANYFYRQQPGSVVHDSSTRAYNSLITDKMQLSFVMEAFKEENDILLKMFNEYIEKLYRAQQRYSLNQHKYNKEEKTRIKKLIKQSYYAIEEYSMEFNGWRNRLLGSSIYIFKLYTGVISLCIKYLKK